jgi:hypothetical protein
MRKIEFGASDLPDSFNLKRYDMCATWGASEWFQGLTPRYDIHLFSTLTPEEMAEDEDNPDLLETLQGYALSFLENPLPVVDGGGRHFPARAKESPIRDLTGADYYDGLFKLNSHWYEAPAELARRACHRAGVMSLEDIVDEVDGRKAYAELERVPAWQIHREANDTVDGYCIEVDLGAPDDHLVKEFRAWLKRVRREAGVPQIPKGFGAEHFADWHSKRLLPYLDLTLWARLNGGSINLSVMGYALFPDEPLRGPKMRDVEAMIRRTVAPQARALTSLEVISTLSRQVGDTA